jgi:hypothetical protein
MLGHLWIVYRDQWIGVADGEELISCGLAVFGALLSCGLARPLTSCELLGLMPDARPPGICPDGADVVPGLFWLAALDPTDGFVGPLLCASAKPPDRIRTASAV